MSNNEPDYKDNLFFDVSKTKAYIHLSMAEVDGDIHITSIGNGDPSDIITLLAYLYRDKPDYFIVAMGKDVQESIGIFKEEVLN